MHFYMNLLLHRHRTMVCRTCQVFLEEYILYTEAEPMKYTQTPTIILYASFPPQRSRILPYLDLAHVFQQMNPLPYPFGLFRVLHLHPLLPTVEDSASAN